MNRLRIIGLVLLAALLVWLAMRSLMPDAPVPVPPQPVREAFLPTKPLRVAILPTDDTANELRWLARELRHLLVHGKMRVAPSHAIAQNASATPFTLRVTWHDSGATGTHAEIALVAPDGIVDERDEIELPEESRLAVMQRFAQRLPEFLNAPSGSADWSAAFGTTDAAAYEEFLRSGDELFDTRATGFTAPPHNADEAALKLERLETLTRHHRHFARARALLSLAYLSVGGEDESSLTKLAETAAERALSDDAQIADAHAALGIVQLRRMEWNTAREHFKAALALDASALAALEGFGCLLMDVGQAHAALPITAQAAALQPGSHGAQRCATYAAIAAGETRELANDMPADIARIHATMQLLAGDRAAAERLLRSSDAASDELISAVITASAAQDKAPDALRVVTRLAGEKAIDADTEILLGTALRRPDFIFNRMLRLARNNEAVPLRVLWLPQTEFLRKHRRFKEVVSAVTLTTYWQDHGLPDVCAIEAGVPGCAVKQR
jgi:tetratricopeptide (TPR) repeat protein